MNHRITPQKASRGESSTVIPAAPGTRLLTPDDDLGDYWQTAVIAWLIVTSSDHDPNAGRAGAVVCVEPITVDSDEFGLPEDYAIQHPGSEHVEIPGAAAYESASAWLADLRTRTQKRTPHDPHH